MRWLLLVAVVLSGAGLLWSQNGHAETTDLVELKSIVHSFDSNGREIVSFGLEETVRPRMFAIYGDHPRLVLDFPGTIYKGKNSITLDPGSLATTIRSGWHTKPKPKTRVVVDIQQGPKFYYKQDYSAADKQLVVTLFRDESAQGGKVASIEAAQPAEKSVLPAKAVLESMPMDQKPVPPVFAKKDQSEKNGGTAPAPPQNQRATSQEKSVIVKEKNRDTSPKLLGVTFDNSSQRGEMVLFHLNDFYPPTVSAIEKNDPKVICEFNEMVVDPDLERNLYANGKFVEKILTTTTTAPDRVKVTLELSPERDYDLQQVFFKNDNLFVLIVNELAKEEKKASK